MSFNGEYTNAYASPSSDYTSLDHYYRGSQFGPKLPATAPSMAHPVLLKQGNPYGYDVLTHDTDGNDYYNVEKAYGSNCQPDYYVAKCPGNEFLRPFIANSNMSGTSPCPVRTQPIVEGYAHSTHGPHPTHGPHDVASQLKHLRILFFHDAGRCPHSLDAIKEYRKQLAPMALEDVFVGVKDISQFNNEKLLTDLGGTATPFFFSQATNRSVTGFLPHLSSLIAGLHGHKESYSSPSSTGSPSEIKDLQVVVFMMRGCMFCDKLKALMANHNVSHLVEYADAQDPKYRQHLQNVRGFPHYMSKKTGKSSTGYPGSLEKMVASLR